MLTARELAASLSVLRELRAPVCASRVLAWGEEETRAFVRLSRSGYVASDDAPMPDKQSAPFGWNRIRATPAGLEYLRQIEG